MTDSALIPKILFAGQLESDAILLSDVCSAVPLPEGVDFESRWKEFVQERQQAGVKCWDAELYRLERLVPDGRTISLELGSIRVMHVLIGAPLVRQRNLGEEYWPKNLFTCGLLRTIEGSYIFAKLSGKTVGNRSIDLVGGALSRDEIQLRSGLDLETALYREFKEELNLGKELITRSEFIGAIRTGALSVGLIFRCYLNCSVDDLQRRFKECNDGEISELIIVEENRLLEFLHSKDSYLPTVGELLCRVSEPNTLG